MSNVGAWDTHWSALSQPIRLGGPEAYARAAEWVATEPLIEDWGCGPGALRRFVVGEYRGVDGSASPFADVHADLLDYHPDDHPAIVMRAVLEHNDEWARLLDNALDSFGRRMVIVLFTPLVRQTRVLMREPDFADVPVIAFDLHDLLGPILDRGITWWIETIDSPATAYGHETLLLLER